MLRSSVRAFFRDGLTKDPVIAPPLHRQCLGIRNDGTIVKIVSRSLGIHRFRGCGNPDARQSTELTSSNPTPPLQNSMLSLEKRGFGDDSGDSLARLTEMFLGSKAAHKTTISTGAAPAGMDRYR